MKIGIIGAMPQEIDLIRDSLVDARDEIVGNRTFHHGSFEGKDVIVAFSRWGKVAAASTATTLINKFGVELVIFTGVAGAVSEDLNVGDIVIADKLLQHDFDASATEMFPKFEIPLLGISHFAVEAGLVSRAESSAARYLNSLPFTRGGLGRGGSEAKIRTGTIASGDQFIASPRKLGELRTSIPGLLCVEMEGAAVAQVCYEHTVPFLVIRSISDKADHSAPVDFVQFVVNVASRYSYGIVKEFLSEY